MVTFWNQIAELTGEVSSSAARAKQGAARMKHLKATAKTTEKEMKVYRVQSRRAGITDQSVRSADTVWKGVRAVVHPAYESCCCCCRHCWCCCCQQHRFTTSNNCVKFLIVRIGVWGAINMHY